MGKGGGKGSTPKRLDDNLKNKQFLNVVDLISEGQIEGPVGGLHGFRLNGTPVVDKHGNPNIHGVTVQWRAGTQSQEPLSDYPFVESEISVGVEVKKDTPILRSVSNRDVDRVRFTVGVSQLIKTDDKGNQENSSVQLSIDVNDGSGWYNAKFVHIGPAKISGPYLEAHTIEAPKKKPFQIRVSRLTDDSKSDRLRNGTVWASYTEITDTLMSYPNSAIAGMRIDRSLFADTPKRSYHIKGMIVQVPDNYDPATRDYKGVWTGRFKPAYTNNPAWIFYDLVTHTRYGIGKLMGAFGCDKFALYAIAQYCDQLVPDGFGGTEPRFTCNAYIANQRKARDVLDDLASVFRGMQVWNGLQLTCFQDRPADPVWTFTNANVVEGKFNYSAAAKKARHTVIEVTWVNPDNGWKEERELIQDDALVDRLGLNVKKVTAFGCTSRGQAHRVGRWIIETEKLETDSVTFSTGREGINCIPGDIVDIADNSFAAARIGGRVLAFSGKDVRLDAPADFAQGESGYFSYMGTAGKFVRVEIESVSGDRVTLKDEPVGLRQWGVFSISKRSLVTRLFRVISIAEDTKTGHYNFTCLQHEPQKEATVDEGVDFQGMPATQNVIRIPNIERLSMAYIQDSNQVQARAMWATTTVNRTITFDVTVYRDTKVVSHGNTRELEYYFSGLDAGVYQVGVRARDDSGMLGDEARVPMVIGAPAAPSVITIEPGFFELKALPHISAPKTLDTQFEFWFSDRPIPDINDVEAQADFLGIAKFWIKGQLKAGTSYWFYVRSVNEFGKSHFVEAEGKPDNNANDILDITGKQFLSSESGKRLAEDLRHHAEKVAEIEKVTEALGDKTLEFESTANQLGNKTLNLEHQLADIAEGTLETTRFTTEVSQRVTEESADRKAEIYRLEQVQANDRETHAKFQEQVSADVAGNAAAVLAVKEAQVTQGEVVSQALDQVKAAMKETEEGVQDVAGRVTRHAEAIAHVTEAQATFERATTSQFASQKSDLSRIETSVTNTEQALAESLLQTSAEFNVFNERQLTAEARIIKNEQAIATESAARAEMGAQITAKFDESAASLVEIKQAQSDTDKALAESTSQLRAEIQSAGDGLQGEIDQQAGALSAISSAFTEQQTALADLEKTTTTLQEKQHSQYEAQQASLGRVENTLTTVETSLAEAVAQVSAEFNGVNGRQLASEAKIVSTEKAIATESEARVEMGGQLSARLDGNEAAIVDVRKAQSETDKSVVETGSQLRAAMKKGDDTLQDGLNQQRGQLSAVNSKVDSQNTLIADLEKTSTEIQARQKSQYDAQQAQIARLNQTVTTQASSQAESALQLAAQASTTAGEQRQIRAEISRVDKARADDRQAFAQSMATLSAKVGENGAVLEEKATAVFDIDGNGYAIKDIGAGVNYKGQFYQAGMVIGAEVKNGQVETHFGVRANQFTVVNPANGKLESVFMVKDGQVFIKEAFLGTAVIDGAKIRDASISMAKIADGLRSDNWPHAGWNLPKNGAFEMKGTSGGARVALDNTGLAVFDGNGVLRVKVGEI
ncbi:TipJ family phage tail tip protein [Xenorhabdus innexi]|uniref:Host specificity protein J n=1 Tax=Xenorhabdus innexi TaxID=290109 RepID=A0A1N6N1R0_9GAMM|nr:phage tail protein [Xenorhabdus innexi]PHM37203.1 host specificity protein J [Xenorhabdus innexi]SIP75016.1 Host specificity protein J (modular protein) [Xenorhabdus innexi]